jgi:hypothetical protein
VETTMARNMKAVGVGMTAVTITTKKMTINFHR